MASWCDVPTINEIRTDIPDPRTPMDARGIGKIGITGSTTAVANSVCDKTGKHIREQTITLSKLI